MKERAKNGSQEQGEQERKKPTLIAYSVKLNDDQAIWTRIGAAWAYKKGPGFSIQLDALPLEGRIVLVAPAVDPRTAGNDV